MSLFAFTILIGSVAVICIGGGAVFNYFEARERARTDGLLRPAFERELNRRAGR